MCTDGVIHGVHLYCKYVEDRVSLRLMSVCSVVVLRRQIKPFGDKTSVDLSNTGFMRLYLIIYHRSKMLYITVKIFTVN